MTGWSSALTLSPDRQVLAGSQEQLVAAIRGGADLRIGTEFRHNEHIDETSPSGELVREVAEFGVTYLIDGQWTAGVMSLRQPVGLPDGFGGRSSMSFFLYNQDGGQAIARLHMDGQPAPGVPGPSPGMASEGMAKYHCRDNWDADTNAPSHNFVYDFDVYRYFVNDRWEQVLDHDDTGAVHCGSVATLATAFADGCSVKVGITGLCTDLADDGEATLAHEVFVETGSGYHYTEGDLFIAGSHPVIRVAPGIPMAYRSGGWDCGWLVLRTDGSVAYRRCDPYTLAFDDRACRCALRWFVSRG